jgi:alkylation response protein AidB-like acyl-CoA dehydrogenase
VDLNLSRAEEAFRAQLRSWFEQNLPPQWRVSRLRSLPDDEAAAICMQWQKKLGAGGWLGLAWPPEYGGRGATMMEQVIFMMEAHRAEAPPTVDRAGLRLLGPTLMELGTLQQKELFLSPLIRGEAVWCQGFSETDAGSDLANLRTRAVLEGDHYIINGHKLWSSNAHYANWCMLLARTNPDAPKHKGITMLAVEMNLPGVTLRPIKQISGMTGGPHGFNEIFFENVSVPRENVIGGIDNGWQVGMKAITYERGLYTMLVQIQFETVWEELREFARLTRRNGQRLIDNLIVREQLAELYSGIRLMRLSNLRYITRYMRGVKPAEESSLMKLHWTDTDQRLFDLAMALGGPMSLIMPKGPRALYDGSWISEYFHSRASSIYGGTQDIQRNLIAERMYGLPR